MRIVANADFGQSETESSTLTEFEKKLFFSKKSFREQNLLVAKFQLFSISDKILAKENKMSEQERQAETDPQKRTHPFVLSNGETVLIKHITSKDYDELNTWIRNQYMANCTDATTDMNIVEKQEFRLAALSHAASLTFLYGDGRDILFGSVFIS